MRSSGTPRTCGGRWTIPRSRSATRPWSWPRSSGSCTVPDRPVRVRPRNGTDLELCVRGLAAVFQDGGYPTNWPADPGGWLTPHGIIGAWVASTEELPVAGHLLLLGRSDGAAEVSRLFVAPAARRHGVAQSLLGRAIDWATAHELDLELEVTDGSGA